MAEDTKGFTVIHNFLKELESREVKYPKNGHMKGAEGKNMIRQYKALKKYPLNILKKYSSENIKKNPALLDTLKKTGKKVGMKTAQKVLLGALVTSGIGAVVAGGWSAHDLHKAYKAYKKKKRKVSGVKHLGLRKKKQYGGSVRRAKYD